MDQQSKQLRQYFQLLGRALLNNHDGRLARCDVHGHRRRGSRHAAKTELESVALALFHIFYHCRQYFCLEPIRRHWD